MRQIQIKPKRIQLEKKGAFGRKPVTVTVPAFGVALPEVHLEKGAARAYADYLTQDGTLARMEADRLVSEGVNDVFRVGFEKRLTDRVRVWALKYYASYPHLLDRKKGRLKGFDPSTVASHFVMKPYEVAGRRGDPEMQEILRVMAQGEDRKRFENEEDYA